MEKEMKSQKFSGKLTRKEMREINGGATVVTVNCVCTDKYKRVWSAVAFDCGVSCYTACNSAFLGGTVKSCH